MLKEESDVLKISKEFYTKLYTKEAESEFEQNYFLRNINKRATAEERGKLDLPISEDEAYAALIDLKKDKSPGDDSLTVEFYIHFWPKLKRLYLKCTAEIKEH